MLASIYLLAFATAIVCGRRLTAIASVSFVDGLMAALLAAALCSTAIALIQWQQLKWSIFIVDLMPGGRPYGNLAQPNQLATLIALGIMSLLRFHERRRFGAFATGISLIFLEFGLVMTSSRTGWLFVALLVTWYFWQRRRSSLRTPPLAVIAFTLIFIIGVATWPLMNEAMLSSVATQGSATALRQAHWATLWDAAWRQPMFGYGWGQITNAQQAAVLDHPAAHEWLLHSHNLILDLIIYNGVPLGAAVLAVLAWWFVRQIRGCRSADQWTLIGAVAIVFVHSLTEYPLHYIYFLLPVALMMGSLEALHPSVGKTARIAPASLAAILAVLVSMLCWVGMEYLRVEVAARQLRLVMAGIGVDKVSTAPLPQVYLLDEPREFHRYWLTPATPDMTPDELAWMRRVSTREASAPSMLRFALAAGLNGLPDEAATTLARLCRMHPIERCDEGRMSWRILQDRYGVLKAVPYPDRVSL